MPSHLPRWTTALALCGFACARPRTGPAEALGYRNSKDTGVFWSPQHRIAVDFVRDTSAAPDSVSGRDGFVKYRLEFSDRRGTVVARAFYSDVYVWASGGGQPLPPAVIFPRIAWSPGEKYALLPQENWEGAQAPALRRIVNLTDDQAWKEIPIRFEHELWIDSAELAGEQPQRCGSGLAVFDGRSGQTRILLPGGKGLDYAIDHYADPYLRVREQSVACPDQAAAAKPHSECLEIDMRSEKIATDECR